jgi:DNA mismatch endonuclease (patch repair protein)
MKTPAPGSPTDDMSPLQRSRTMSRIRSSNTTPELQIRRALHGLGFRYRIHVKVLPGKPDLVFPKFKAVIFVHGCFWHGHGCHNFRWPKGNADYWRPKIESNIRRDFIAIERLQDMGWRVLVVWECLLRGKGRLPVKVVAMRVAGWLLGEETAPLWCDKIESGQIDCPPSAGVRCALQQTAMNHASN